MRYLPLFALIVGVQFAMAQAGDSGFAILNLPSSARSSAQGGGLVALAQQDLSVVGDNPALLDSVPSGDFYLQYSPFFGGINLLNAGYAFRAGGAGDFALSLSYLNYGELDQTDVLGQSIGSFTPQDYQLRLTKSHRLGPFVLGANLKFVHSSIAGFGASAIAGDLGGVFTHPNVDLAVGVVVRNLGLVVSDYVASSVELPVDLQLGISFKPRYMPARFNLGLSNLGQDLNYFDEFPTDGQQTSRVDGFLRHLSTGLELYVGKAVTAMVGYNHLRNQELKLTQGNFGAGFSFGLAVKIKGMQIQFSRATYHAGGGLNTLGVQGSLFAKKKLF